MINIQTVNALLKHGFTMTEIKTAVNFAEQYGEANLHGWLIRYNDRGEMITLHPSWGGIYVGDYTARLIFQKNLSYSYGKFGYMPANHGDLAKVLDRLDENKTNGYILCECNASSYKRRKKQVEKLGYKVYKSNIDHCDSDIATCVFLIA